MLPPLHACASILLKGKKRQREKGRGYYITEAPYIFLLYSFKSLDKGTIEHGSPVAAAALDEPVALEFDVSETVSKALVTAQTNFDKLISAHEVQVIQFK